MMIKNKVLIYCNTHGVDMKKIGRMYFCEMCIEERIKDEEYLEKWRNVSSIK